MRTLYMTKGLPASGKTSWAKSEQEKNERLIRINNDELRRMLHGGVYSKENEKIIKEYRNLLLTETLKKGVNDVVIDNTNLVPDHENRYATLAYNYNYDFVVKDFTHVPVNICIERDKNRQYYVGEKVILDMYKKFIRKEPTAPVWDTNLDKICAIVDIDGTLAINRHRNPYDESRVYEDEVNTVVQRAIHDTVLPYVDRLFVFSGRTDNCIEETRNWLIDKCDFTDFVLCMRKAGDRRPDWEVKREMYYNEVHNKYNVYLVLDDRQSVVDLTWRSLGLPVWQVNEGNF